MANVNQEADYILAQLPLIMASHPGSEACRCMCGVHNSGFCSARATDRRSFLKSDGTPVTVPMCAACAAAIDERVERLTGQLSTEAVQQ